ncbi:Hypothetical predicted protein [Mytilus galloprovincialis]|uniref:Uncharacterized protein n=1 Tax=Mytilus galloprovincialis TaxID=29158 RepID=A0A8B6DWC9_MYTGA|nr:Hypothetical predicted protein [Mytilus galloprovincialis]
MNGISRNDEKDNDQNVCGLRKTTYLEKYGVKHFPYRGRRRYTPSVDRSEDGGIFISNDVFGLTIRQFERMYKACLDRRKANEQYILNIRYPDKTSEVKMPKNLVKTVGTEIDIRNRQQLFNIQDSIANAQAQKPFTQISSGSLAEGIDLPGSDIDIMYVMKEIDVIQDVRNIKHPVQRTTFLMETHTDHPGFGRLRLIAGGDGKNDMFNI